MVESLENEACWKEVRSLGRTLKGNGRILVFFSSFLPPGAWCNHLLYHLLLPWYAAFIRDWKQMGSLHLALKAPELWSKISFLPLQINCLAYFGIVTERLTLSPSQKLSLPWAETRSLWAFLDFFLLHVQGILHSYWGNMLPGKTLDLACSKFLFIAADLHSQWPHYPAVWAPSIKSSTMFTAWTGT